MSKSTLLREGRVRLRRLLPEARAMLARDTYETRDLSGIAKAQMRHFAEDNLEAVVIYRGEYGGWIADVRLRKVPAGIAGSFGTPVKSPWPTREEAEASAVHLLAFALGAAAQVKAEPAAAPPPERVFEYFGLIVAMPEDVLTTMEQATAALPHLRYGSHEVALHRLDEVTERLFPDGQVTEAAANALAREDSARLMTTLMMAALEGMFRYPVPRSEPVGRYSPTGEWAVGEDE